MRKRTTDKNVVTSAGESDPTGRSWHREVLNQLDPLLRRNHKQFRR